MTIPYIEILYLIAGMAFFARGARADGKSPLLWGILSGFGWFVTFWILDGGFGTWVLSQVALFAVLFGWKVLEERKREGDGVAR